MEGKIDLLNIRKVKNDLKKKSMDLRHISSQENVSYKNSMNIRKEQDDMFKKLKFYEGFLNVMDNKKEVKNA